MQRSDFLKMIESYGPADRQSVNDVSELISVFPYFQSAYSLLLKGLRNTSDVRFENQLRISAMYIANREVLYYFLKKEAKPVPETETAERENIFAVATDNTDNQQTVIETGKSSTDLINEIEKDSPANDPESSQENHSKVVEEEFSPDDSNASILIIDEESGEVDEKITYMDPGFSIPEKTDLLELDRNEQIAEESEIESVEPEFSESGHPEKVSLKEVQSALIDKFIEANPRIEPVRERSDKPLIDISVPFTEGGEKFITETLARIYIGQGYYTKAINIYERLSLKYPEKSTYFAAQIEKVKELLKK